MNSIPAPSISLPALLPLLFSPSPTPLPLSILSPTTSLSHKFLSTSPSSPSYLALLPSDRLSALHTRLVERGWSDLRLGPDHYTIEDGGIRGRVQVSLVDEDPAEKDALAVDLVWEAGGREGDDDGTPRWLFVTLSLVTKDSTPQGWFSSIEAASRSATPPSPPAPRTPREADFLPPRSIAIPRPSKSTTDMAEGEGTTPGAYGAAEDFWAGWSEDGEAEADNEERETYLREESEKQEDEKREGYWAQYGAVETSIGEVDLEEEEAEEQHSNANGRPKSITRSRRSSTIRGPAIATPPPTTPSGDSPFFQPLPPPSYISPAPSPAAPSPTLVSVPSPSLSPTNGAESADMTPQATATTNGFHPTPAAVSPKRGQDEDEALQFALAGVWSLYAKGATWDELERKKEKWDRMARMVSRS
ncbi:hypothetical protein RQP46_003732 [Phenoliferia psychrophenolica]